MYTLSKHASINRAIPIMSFCHMHVHDHEENHGITLRRLKQVLIPITQILQCRALEHNVLLILHPAGTEYRICLVRNS